MASRHGQLPIETLLLALLVGGLLVYPLLQAPGHDASLRQHRNVVLPEPFLSGVLRLKDLSMAMGGIEYHGPRYRDGFAAAASVRVQPVPGWPTDGSPSLLERKLELPAGWSLQLLIFEDFGIVAYTIDPERLELHLSLGKEPALIGRPPRQQLEGHGASAASTRDLEGLVLPPLAFAGSNTPTSFQMPIVFKREVDFDALTAAELVFGTGIDRLTLESPLPPTPGDGEGGR